LLFGTYYFAGGDAQLQTTRDVSFASHIKKYVFIFLQKMSTIRPAIQRIDTMIADLQVRLGIKALVSEESSVSMKTLHPLTNAMRRIDNVICGVENALQVTCVRFTDIQTHRYRHLFWRESNAQIMCANLGISKM
jgi:hypothetical protein